MSNEFEGYQDNSAAPGPQYESMAAQPQYDPETGEAPIAEAYPVGEPIEATAHGVESVAEKANAQIAGFLDKIGKMGMLLGIMVTSLIYTIASGATCWSVISPGVAVLGCAGIYGYAFSVGMISFLGSLIYIILLRYASGLENNNLVENIAAWFFAVWWIAGAGAGTFSAPFTSSSNGYFSAWGAVFFSVAYLLAVSPIAKAQMARLKDAVAGQAFGDQIGIIVCSVIELIDASASCGVCVSYEAFAVSLGVISIVITAISIFLVKSNNASQAYASAFSAISIFLFIWWAVGFCVVTFHSPFLNTGNGYFASLGALLFATRLVRTTSMWQQLEAKAKLAAAGAGVGQTANDAPTTAATYAEEPDYAPSYTENSEGMDF